MPGAGKGFRDFGPPYAGAAFGRDIERMIAEYPEAPRGICSALSRNILDNEGIYSQFGRNGRAGGAVMLNVR